MVAIGSTLVYVWFYWECATPPHVQVRQCQGRRQVCKCGGAEKLLSEYMPPLVYTLALHVTQFYQAFPTASDKHWSEKA